jgi:hypothetical protein
MAIRVVVSRWTRFRFVRDVSATHRQSFAAAGFLAIGVMQGALSRGSCSNSEGRQTRWSYPNHPNVCSVQARRALKLRGGHSNNEVTENQAEYWSWVAFYLRSDLGINATAARLPRSALESCARLWIRRDRRRKSYLGRRHCGGVLARSASVWCDLTARMTEESVVTPTVFTGQYLSYPVAEAGSMKSMG